MKRLKSAAENRMEEAESHQRAEPDTDGGVQANHGFPLQN